MKTDKPGHSGVQDLCRKLKEQLDTLAATIVTDNAATTEEKQRRQELMSKLKKQLADLSL